MTNASSESADVLVVEDNPGEVRLLEEAFTTATQVDSLHVVTNGDEALDFVFQRGPYADAPRPDIVLLNWGLPKTTGETVLSEIKGTEGVRRIPVIVITGSQSRHATLRAYELQANAYVRKPAGPTGFSELAGSIERFWLQRAILPAVEDSDRLPER